MFYSKRIKTENGSDKSRFGETEQKSSRHGFTLQTDYLRYGEYFIGFGNTLL